MKKPKIKSHKRLKPLSLYPLKPEKALSLFMQIAPKGKRGVKRKDQKKLALSSA